MDRTLRTLDEQQAKGSVAPNATASLSRMPEYAFHHALIRDVADESLPKAPRADKRVVTARWAELQAGDRCEEIAEVLATHHLRALRWLDELGELEHGEVDRDSHYSAGPWRSRVAWAIGRPRPTR